MGQAARVHSIDAVRDWKDNLTVFQVAAQEALISIDMEVRRTFDWLEDQRRHWQQEIQRWDEIVVQAKSELWRRKNMPIIRNMDYIEQEKDLRRAQARLAEAEERLEKTRKWIVNLRRAFDEYKGSGNRLGTMLEGDVTDALALLARKIKALEGYLAVAPPVTSGPATAPAPAAETPTEKKPS